MFLLPGKGVAFHRGLPGVRRTPSIILIYDRYLLSWLFFILSKYLLLVGPLDRRPSIVLGSYVAGINAPILPSSRWLLAGIASLYRIAVGYPITSSLSLWHAPVFL